MKQRVWLLYKQYGLNLSISKIREAASTDKQGTNAYGMIKAAEQLGFSAKGVKDDQNAFFSEFPLPAIAHVVVTEVCCIMLLYIR